MVMSALRDKIKIVILITMAAFVGLIFFDWGMQGGGRGPSQPNVIARVNGREISYDVYRQTRMNVLAAFEQRTGRPAEFGDLDAVEDDTWLQLVQEAVLGQEIETHRITVSDAEILAMMRTDPPDFVRAGFLDQDGNFDPVRYSQALADPAWASQWALVENQIRLALPISKLQNFVSLNVRVTSGEVHDLFVTQNEKVKVSYVASLPSSVKLPDDAITDADLEAFYREHEADYQVGRQAVLEVVKVSKAASAQDSADVRADLADVRDMAIEGTDDFATIASRFSDDPSAERGGDLGFIARGDMPKALEDVAFSTDVGAVSDVFASPFGYHFLKVEERKTENGVEKVHVRHVLMRVEASNTTLRDASERIGDFLDAIAEGQDFRAAAEELRLPVEETAPFERNGFIQGLGLLRPAQRFAFSHPVGATTADPIEDAEHLYAFRLAEMKEPRTRPLDEVRDAVRIRVTEEKRRTAAREQLESAIAAADGSLAGIAAQLGTQVGTTAEFSREAFVPGVGRRNAFVAAAFSLPENTVSGVIDSDRGYYVLEVVERIPADDADFVEQQEHLRRTLLLRKRRTFFSAWLEKKVADAEVVDFRGGKGVDWSPDASLLVYSTAGEA